MFVYFCQEMDERRREVLQKCSEYLIHNVRPEPVVDRLHADVILTADDVERLSQQTTTNDKNKLLLGMLPRAGRDAFSSFVTALKETEQPFIAEQLLAQLEKCLFFFVHS